MKYILLPPIFVPYDNYRNKISSLTFIDDIKNDVSLVAWWTKGWRSPTGVHQAT